MGNNTTRQKNKDKQRNSDDEAYADVEAEELVQVTTELISRGLEACPNQRKRAQFAQKIREILEEAQEQIASEIPIPIPISEENLLTPPSPAAQQVLENEVIIRLLLSHLDSSSLLSGRLVCKTWEFSATHQLCTRRHENKFKIKFSWHGKSKNYRHKNGKGLEDFYETFENCGNNVKARQFLCSQNRFVFEDGDLSSTLPLFFKELGGLVRFLTLKPVGYDKTEEFKVTLRSILLELTPNLQSLSFKSSGHHGANVLDKNPDQNSDSGLEKLKVLKLTRFGKEADGFYKKVVIEQTDSLVQMREIARNMDVEPDENTNPLSTHTRRIMEFSPNLELILDPELFHTGQIVAAGKFHLVKSLDLTFPPDHPNLIVKFAAAGPKLSSLNLMIKKREIPSRAEVRALNSILQSSQSTLRDFRGVENLKHIKRIQLPVFPLVEKLRLAQSLKMSADGRILPSSFKFSQVFPNLTSLHFESHFQEAHRPDNPFNLAGNGNALGGLQHLEFRVHRDFDPLWMEKISSLYPNLNSLHVNIKKSGGFSLFPPICKSIWSVLTRLAKLHFTLDADAQSSCQGDGEEESESEETDEEKNITDETDAIFTGVSVKTCRKLKKENSKLKMSDELREFPSILDMKKLTELKISCVKIHPRKLWSHLTEIHGFEKMKQQQNCRVQVTRRI